MTLTGHLRSPDSPVQHWMLDHFGNTRELAAETNTVLRGGPGATPCVVPVPAGGDAQLAGTAVGVVLAAYLSPGEFGAPAASRGALNLAPLARIEGVAVDPIALNHEAAQRLQLALRGRELSAADWDQVARAALIVARFEQLYRSGPKLIPAMIDAIDFVDTPIETIAGSMADVQTRRDLAELSYAACVDHGHIRTARRVVLEAEFDQSAALGGAAADVIYDGVLIDFKAGGRSTVVGRQELWQLLGYLLADTSDHYEIGEVGFSALRRRRTRLWPVQEFVDAMAVEHRPLAVWRTEFRDLLAQLPPLRRRPRVAAEAQSRRETADWLARPETAAAIIEADAALDAGDLVSGEALRAEFGLPQH